MPETFDHFPCGCEHPQGEVTECDNCNECDNCCECSTCDSCCERYESGHCGNDECSLCPGCCTCRFCDGCGTFIGDEDHSDDFCCDCDSCESCYCTNCCTSDRCDDCGDTDCSCNAGHVRNYSTCPLDALHYHPKYLYCPLPQQINIARPRLGIEIEMSEWDEASHVRINDVASRLINKYVLCCDADGYNIACDDGSISGSRPAECKTVPMYQSSHLAVHYAYLHDENEWVPSAQAIMKATPRNQLRMLAKRLADHPSKRWQPGSKSWSNRSCGIHVTVPTSIASKLTWIKAMYMLYSNSELCQFIGGRPPNSYCSATLPEACYECDILPYVHRDYETNNKYRSCTLPDLASGTVFKADMSRVRSKRHRVNGKGVTLATFSPTKYAPLHYKRLFDLFEFRMFRSSTNPLRIMASLELVIAFLRWVDRVPLHALGQPLVTQWPLGRQGFEVFLKENSFRYPFAARAALSV